MPATTHRFANIMAGDPAPIFKQRAAGAPVFDLSSFGGRYLVLCFFVSTSIELARSAIATAYDRGDLFDGRFASFVGISNDPGDETESRLETRPAGCEVVWDFDGRASRLYGVVSMEATLGGGTIQAQPTCVVLDPTSRVLKAIRLGPEGTFDDVIGFLEALPSPELFAGMALQAPIVLLPNVFEPELCRRLVDLYERVGGEESGVMQDIAGKTVGVLNPAYKRRRDCTIEDEDLLATIRSRFTRRILPEIAKVHQFTVTRMERYIVACYAAEDGGHFGAHRDNTTRGTAHRRFACSINLNADFEGGEVGFPEYGPRTFKPPAGGAVVFSCSLLHSVTRVTHGRRYAFLPFLYDDAAAAVREANLGFVASTAGPGSPRAEAA